MSPVAPSLVLVLNAKAPPEGEAYGLVIDAGVQPSEERDMAIVPEIPTFPYTDSIWLGVVVPIPTLPLIIIPLVGAALMPA